MLGRRVFTYFERKPGKIPFIYPGNTPSKPPNHMKLVHERHWVLYSLSSDSMMHRPEAEEEEPIVRLKSVMEVITWMVINKMWNPETRLYFGGRMAHGLTEDIKQVLVEMHTFFLGKQVFETSRGSLLGGRHAVRALVVPNFGLPDSPRQLLHIDIVHQDTYGEYTYRRLTPNEAYKVVTEMAQKAEEGIDSFIRKVAVPVSLEDPRLADEFETGLKRYQNDISGNTGKKKKARLDI